MKKILPFILLLLFASWSYAGQGAMPGMGIKGYAAASCTSANDSVKVNSGVGDTALEMGAWGCTQVTIAANMTLTGYLIDACYSAGSGNITVWLYNNSADAPTTAVADTSAVIAHTSLDACTTHGQKEVLLGTPKTGITSGTYWVCQNQDSGALTLNNWYLASSGRITFGASVTENNTASYSWGGAVLGCAE